MKTADHVVREFAPLIALSLLQSGQTFICESQGFNPDSIYMVLKRDSVEKEFMTDLSTESVVVADLSNGETMIVSRTSPVIPVHAVAASRSKNTTVFDVKRN